MVLTWRTSEILHRATAAWCVSHPERRRCPECSPPAWPPAWCGWYQDDQCNCWGCSLEELSFFRWSLHSQQNLTNCQFEVEITFPQRAKLETQDWPDLGSLTKFKMVPGLPLTLKHRTSPLSGSIMKWGSPSTRKSSRTCMNVLQSCCCVV